MLPALAQYTVTKVIGNVINKTTGAKIGIGNKLSDNDQLGWSSGKDMIRAIVAGKGVFIITPNAQTTSGQNALVEYVKMSLKIKAKEGYLSGRAEAGEPIPASLQTEATVNARNRFGTENSYLFNEKEYNLSNGSRFFLQIDVPGSKPMIRTLKTKADTLFIQAGDLEVPDSTATYKLGFYAGDTKTSLLLVQFKPVLDKTNEMENIIRLLVAGREATNRETLRQECYAEVYEALGRPADIQFNAAFDAAVLKPGQKFQ